jgi:probable F420-dependent oxidoreductase
MPDPRTSLRHALGRLGVWSFALQTHPAAEERAAVATWAALGYGATWFPESLGSKEVFAHAAILLSAGQRMVVASGIANIHARDPMAMMGGARALAEAYPGRFVLGIGVSHAPAVAARGGAYGRPIEQMRAYLDAMDAAPYVGPAPAVAVPVMLAALGPRMLELAGERTVGAHTYFVPVEHTVEARQRLGPGPVLAVELTAVLDTDRARASAVAHGFAARYLGMPNYANNLRRLGWSDADVVGSGSERLIQAVVVQGGAAEIADRVRQHLDAGADHVCVQLRSEDASDLALGAYAELRAALADLPPGVSTEG